ncbi:MAG: hypothetical protein V3U11_09740, partial [Planctomycetota bacterium]
AISAKEGLDPWYDEDLRDFLGADEVLVLAAALEVCAERDSRPADLIIHLLGHEDARIRAAAVAAMPRLESGTDLDLLCEFARRSRGAAALAAAEALGRTALPNEAEHCLYDLLGREDWMVVRAALASLSSKEGHLADVRPILAVLVNRRKAVEERLYGFIAMETTGTIPSRQIKRMLPNLHPILRLLGARCLVTAGDRSGLPVLIGLLDTEESDTLDDEEVHCVRRGARSVLTEIAGEDLGADSEAWQRWYRKFADMAPIRLQTLAPTFW